MPQQSSTTPTLPTIEEEETSAAESASVVVPPAPVEESHLETKFEVEEKVEEPPPEKEEKIDWAHALDEFCHETLTLHECTAVVSSLKTRFYYLVARLRVLHAQMIAIWWRRRVKLLKARPEANGHKLSLVAPFRDIAVLQEYLQKLRWSLYLVATVLRGLRVNERKRYLLLCTIFRFLRFCEDYCRPKLEQFDQFMVKTCRAVKTKKIQVDTQNLLTWKITMQACHKRVECHS